MNSKGRRQSTASQSRGVNWCRVLLKELGLSTKSSERDTTIQAQDTATSFVHTIFAQQNRTFDWDPEKLWDLISDKQDGELFHQQANVTPAVGKALGCPTSNVSAGEDHTSKPFSHDEIASILDIVYGQPSAYPGIWEKSAYSASEPSFWVRAKQIEVAIVRAIATASAMACDSHIPQVQDPLLVKAAGAFAPGTDNYDVQPLDFDVTSLFAEVGSFRSVDPKSGHKALVINSPTPSLEAFGTPHLSDINHQNHPAFRSCSPNPISRVLATDTSHRSNDVGVYYDDLFGQCLSPRVLSGTTKWISPVDAFALSSHCVNDEASNGSDTAGLVKNLYLMVPDSPTLGVHADYDAWSFSGHGENTTHSDRVQTWAPLRFNPSAAVYAGRSDQAVPECLSPETHPCTNSCLRFSVSSKGNRNHFPSQHGFEDDDTAFLHHGLDGQLFEEADFTLRDDIDQWLAGKVWEDDGVENDETLDCGEIEQAFSQAFLLSPLCPTNKQRSPPTPRTPVSQPEDIIKQGPSRATASVGVKNLEILRSYRREAAGKAPESSPLQDLGDLLAQKSRHTARSSTRPTLPSDKQVNRDLPKINPTNPMNLDLSRIESEAVRSHEIGFAVGTTVPFIWGTSTECTTFRPGLDPQPRTTPLYKKLAKKVNLRINTTSDKLASNPPRTPHTSDSTTNKKTRLTGSWSRKIRLPAKREVVSGADSLCSPLIQLSLSDGNTSDLMSFTPPESPRSISEMNPAIQQHHQSPPPPTAPSTPIEELPLIPLRNPLRIACVRASKDAEPRTSPDRQACHSSPLESITFINQLDPKVRKFYVKNKPDQLRERENRRVVYQGPFDPRAVYMRHPRHSRVWNWLNLRCSVHEGSCPICSAACCRHEYSVRIIQDLASLPEEKTHASNLLSEIKAWCQTDEEPTFVSCRDCTRSVCPSCAGECAMCRTITCKACQPAPWDTCGRH